MSLTGYFNLLSFIFSSMYQETKYIQRILNNCNWLNFVVSSYKISFSSTCIILHPVIKYVFQHVFCLDGLKVFVFSGTSETNIRLMQRVPSSLLIYFYSRFP